MKKVKIMAMAGSLRRDSFNKKLVNFAAEAAREAGAEVTVVDLKEYPLPVYDGDIEESSGLPENALKLKEIMKDADALLLSCPEYNSSITGVLKNTIDWISRPGPGEKPGEKAAFQNKVAVLFSASPGALGGLRGLDHVRSILSNMGVMVLPGQKAVANANKVFDENGHLTNERDAEAVTSLARQLVEVTSNLQ